MSTDDERPDVPAVPRTRAELRAAREAEAARAAAAEPAVTAREPAPETNPASEPEAAPTPEPAPAPALAPTSEPEPAPASEPAPEPTLARKPKPAPEPAPESGSKPPRDRRFLLVLGAVVGVLALIGAGLGVFSLTQGPRVTEVQVDPVTAIEASGSRVILTTNQPLAAIDESQVTVEPAVPFTLDTAGRGVGVRFTVPLDDDTEYSVRITDVTSSSGGPATTLSTSFTTPASSLFLLQRSAKEDTIFRTDLAGDGVPVFTADKINDFRATSTQLVASIEEDDGSKLLVMNRDGSDPRELPLPGEGYVGAIQVSDRGGLVGYSYSDKILNDTEGRASVLVIQSLNGTDEPVVTQVGGTDASVFVWQFVPDSAAALFIDFDGALSLIDRSTDAGVQSLGLAATIQGISRGTYTAIVERLDGSVVELNLTDGSEVPLEASNPDYGVATTIAPFPGGTLRHVVARDEQGMPTGQAIIRVDDDGSATPLVEVPETESILQACASPSGQYAAVVIAPDLLNNPYDQLMLPLPEKLETHFLDLRTGDEIVALSGFDASWCQTAPRF